MTVIEKIILEIDNELQTLESCHGKEIFGRKVGLAFAKRVANQAKEMEKEQKIEFACAVYDKYNFGLQEISFREECEQFKLE